MITIIFFGGGFAALYYVWHRVGSAIRRTINELEILKKNYLALLSCDDLTAVIKTKHKRRIMIFSVLFAVAAVIITTVCIVSVKLVNTYNEAVTLVDKGSYFEAGKLFEKIEESGYRDTSAYISLCKAHSCYDSGNIPGAYSVMKSVRFNCLTAEQNKAVESFMAVIRDEYAVCMKEKKEADDRAYRKKIAEGVPFVGMPESEIANTSLGAPSDTMRHNYAHIGGKVYIANLYDFKQGGQTIFTARCVQGKVTEVWDDRNTPPAAYIPKKKSKNEEDDDPYDVNDYSNEEDFYDDHYYDFFDYYDAENYYREHHK